MRELPAVFRKPLGPLGINPKYKRQIVESNDGGTVSVDWFRSVSASTCAVCHVCKLREHCHGITEAFASGLPSACIMCPSSDVVHEHCRKRSNVH